MTPSLLLDLQNVLITMALVVPRTLVCLLILPASGINAITGVLRNSVAFAIALPAAVPTFFYVRDNPPDYFLAVMLLFKEVVLGALLGILMAIPLWVAQSVGSVLDSQRNPIQIQNTNSAIDQDASVLGGMLVQAVFLVMIQAGLFGALCALLVESYATWKVFDFLPPFQEGHFTIFIERIGRFFWYLVVYGGPVLIPLILIDFSFAILGVFAPNLQVSFASSPIKCVTGLFIVLVYWPTFSHYVAGDFSHLLDLAASLIGASPSR